MSELQQTVEWDGVVFDSESGNLYQRFKLVNHVCDICGYVDATKGKTAVIKCDDGIYRCKVCSYKLGEEWM